MSVLQRLEPAWTRAFLRRTRFLDPDFQGDVLAMISKVSTKSHVSTPLTYVISVGVISTALRTGTPLPQITPCPLLDRFIIYHHGLNVMRHEDDDDYGLPRTLSMDVLEDEQYMSVACGLPSQASVDILFRCFCVGVSTSFGIVTRFDRLMHATKELVGEQYHIHGVGHVSKVGGIEMVSGTDLVRPIHDA
jgi:hypothetical protein